MENYKKKFLKDIKEEREIKNDFDVKSESQNSFDLLMCFFASSKIDDLEKHEQVKEDYYKELGWNDNNYFDVINSFWTTFTWAMHCSNREKYWIADAGNVKNVYKNPYRKYPSFSQKYNNNEDETTENVKHMLNTFQKFEELAKLCHCVANFMPCPDRRFNGLKGRLFEVKDYFPLMIDKIQKHIDENCAIVYCRNDCKITIDELKEWRNWFIKYRKEYCLEDYYRIIPEYNGESVDYDDFRLVGIPLFEKQSLDYPVPKTVSELEKCLEEMINRIKTRAMRMAKKLEK